MKTKESKTDLATEKILAKIGKEALAFLPSGSTQARVEFVTPKGHTVEAIASKHCLLFKKASIRTLSGPSRGLGKMEVASVTFNHPSLLGQMQQALQRRSQ